MAELHTPSDQTLDSLSVHADQPVDSVSASESPPSLVRTVSASRLSAKAPEFVPGKTPPASRHSTPPLIVITPPPSPPPPIVHVFSQHPPFHVAIPPQNQVTLAQGQHQQGQLQFRQPSPQPHHVQHHQYQSGSNHKHHGQFVGGGGEPDVAAQGQQVSSHSKDHGNGTSSNGLSEEATQKILNQVEYYFSDINLATTDHLIRFMNKDPEAYVPMSVVASFKKIKALVSSNSQLADVLRNSTKLVVSEDGKKVKRFHPLTGLDMEELQCRIIVAENLPEDHCYQNLMKIFSSVGSVKSIRTCQPQTVNTGAPSAARQSKMDNTLHSSKLHAFVEYESIELAEKAVLEMNDEANWRNGLRVRLLLKRSSKSQQAARGKKAGNGSNANNEEDGTSTSEQFQDDRQLDDHSGETELYPHEQAGDEQGTENEGGGQKKGRNRGSTTRGKGRGRGQSHTRIAIPPINPTHTSPEHPTLARTPPGPRMPDGTRGFSMGRGKPLAS